MNASCNDRILIKLSGEALGANESSVDIQQLNFIGNELNQAWSEHPHLAVVIGGGNFYRGGSQMSEHITRLHADYVGMLATVMNGIILQQWFQTKGLPAELLSAFPVASFCESYSPSRAGQLLDSGSLVILCGGIGSPYFTTDTSACLRALEIGATTIIKATRVDGVFTDDPEIQPNAKKFDNLNYETALTQRLKIMDATAFALCRENDLTVRVLKIQKTGNLRRAIRGEGVGTLITR